MIKHNYFLTYDIDMSEFSFTYHNFYKCKQGCSQERSIRSNKAPRLLYIFFYILTKN